MIYIIKSIEDLNSLPSKRNIKFNRISIQHPYIDRITLSGLEKRLNKSYFACGCKTGSLFTLVAILICIIHLMVYLNQFAINSLLYYLVIVGGGAITGKLVGLLSAKINFVKTRRKIALLYSMSSYQEDVHLFETIAQTPNN